MFNKNHTSLESLLNNFLKYRALQDIEEINFDRINIKSKNEMGILSSLFSRCARSEKELDTMFGIDLSEESVFMLFNGNNMNVIDSLTDIANIDDKGQIVTPKERLSCDLFVFHRCILVEEKNSNSLSKLCSFANELKDSKITLYNSKEYIIEPDYIYALFDVLNELNKINKQISSIDFIVNYNGSIQLTFNSLEIPTFNFTIEANNIIHLNDLLKNINSDNFIKFLIVNQLALTYSDNILECKKLSKVNVFYFDAIKVKITDELFKYFIRNINLTDIDSQYKPFKPFLSNMLELFKTSSNDIKLKIFKSIFSSDNQEVTSQFITDQEIADIYQTTKNNIVETYKKRKTDQYEILRLGTSCKKLGITEDELLSLIASCGLERVENLNKEEMR